MVRTSALALLLLCLPLAGNALELEDCRINAGPGDRERYRQFSVGRAESFEASGLADVQSPPGTAIGGPQGSPFTVVLLASRHPCQLVENPRQMSAFEYPADYGPRSPKFSRGGVLSLPVAPPPPPPGRR